MRNELFHAGFEFVPDQNEEQCILVKSMDKWLARCCYRLNICNPTFHCEEHILREGTPIYRFMVTLDNNNFGKKLLAFGRFAADAEVAREDSALAMLRELVQTTGLIIRDFNHDSVACLHDRVRQLESEVSSLSKENAFLKEHLARGRPQAGYSYHIR